MFVLIMDKAESNLHTFLNGVARPISQKDAVNMLCKIGLGLKHVHMEITHGNLKPTNIMIMEDNVFKIADFGITKEQLDSHVTMISERDRLYTAPELLLMERGGILAPLK